jgi:hypothetical protein
MSTSKNLDSKINRLFIRPTVEIESAGESDSDSDFDSVPVPQAPKNANGKSDYSNIINQPRDNNWEGLDDISMLNRIEKLRHSYYNKDLDIKKTVVDAKRVNQDLMDLMTVINATSKNYKSELTNKIGKLFTNAYESELLSQNKMPDNYSGTLRQCLAQLTNNINTNCSIIENVVSINTQVLEPKLEMFLFKSTNLINKLIDLLEVITSKNEEYIKEIENSINKTTDFDDDLDSVPQ